MTPASYTAKTHRRVVKSIPLGRDEIMIVGTSINTKGLSDREFGELCQSYTKKIDITDTPIGLGPELLRSDETLDGLLKC